MSLLLALTGSGIANGDATAALAQIILTAPSGFGTATSNAAAAGSLTGISLSAIAAAASGAAAASTSLPTFGMVAPLGTAYIDAIAFAALTDISLTAASATAAGEINALPMDDFNYAAAYNARHLGNSQADPAISRAYLRSRRRRAW